MTPEQWQQLDKTVDLRHLISDLSDSEGVERYAYDDATGLRVHAAKGNLSIGIGRNLDAKPLSPHIIYMMLDEDIREAADIGHSYCPEFWSHYPEHISRALIELWFNMGNRFSPTAWPTFFKHLSAKDYKDCATSLVNSRWYSQVQLLRSRRIVLQFDPTYYDTVVS